MDSESGLWRGVLAIVVTGALLGIAQNALVRASSKEAGLAWKWKPKELPKLPTSGSDAGDNPLGKIGPGVDIPDLGQPLEIAVELVREYVDTQTAAIIDGRDAAGL